MTLPVALVPVRSDMYGPLAEFNAAFPAETRPVEFWLDRFRLWWEGNPAWDASLPRGWALVQNDRIIGFVGLFPAFFQIDGGETHAWISTTWRVDAAHRGQSLRLMTSVVSTVGQGILFSTTLNPELAPVLQALGYRRMPADGAQRSLLILDAGRFAAAMLTNRAALTAARLAAPVLRRAHVASFRLLSSARYETRTIQSAREEFDGYWNRTRAQRRHVTVRNASWVNWQCFSNRWYAKDVVATYRGSELQGFAVAMPVSWKQLRVLDCVDLWFEFGRPDVAVSLVRGLCDLAIDRRCDVVQVPHFNPEIRSALKGHGLLKVMREPIVGFWRGPKSLLESATSADAYLTLIEGDRFL